jgi:cytochrome c553
VKSNSSLMTVPTAFQLLAAAVLFTLASSAIAKGDADAGATRAKSCMACHGNDGNADADQQYPRLSGQYADYIARALHEYQNGDRKNPTMAGMAKPLSNEDIDDIAAFFASKPGKLHDLSQRKK